MAWDKQHVLHLLREVSRTKGRASLLKSQELLDYDTRNGNEEQPASSSSVKDREDVGKSPSNGC